MPTIASELLRTQAVRRVDAPGSTAVSRLLMNWCADHVSSERGIAPFIVFDDADLDIAAA